VSSSSMAAAAAASAAAGVLTLALPLLVCGFAFFASAAARFLAASAAAARCRWLSSAICHIHTRSRNSHAHMCRAECARSHHTHLFLERRIALAASLLRAHNRQYIITSHHTSTYLDARALRLHGIDDRLCARYHARHGGADDGCARVVTANAYRHATTCHHRTHHATNTLPPVPALTIAVTIITRIASASAAATIGLRDVHASEHTQSQSQCVHVHNTPCARAMYRTHRHRSRGRRQRPSQTPESEWPAARTVSQHISYCRTQHSHKTLYTVTRNQSHATCSQAAAASVII
jgi:hypothetical protein